MKIFFTASGRGVDEFESQYQAIYDAIVTLGHKHVDDEIVNKNKVSEYYQTHQNKVDHYQKTQKCLRQADIVVLEISEHSLSMGFIMERALEGGKPVIALYTPSNFPFFASGINNAKLQVLEYNQENVVEVLEAAINYAKDNNDTRFNFFISPRHIAFLDWVSQKRRIPRSVYLRELIEGDKRANKEYHAQ